MGDYTSKPETLQHKRLVLKNICDITRELTLRGLQHDNSKLEQGEVEYFDEFTPYLASSTYGSTEYRQLLEGLKPALQHHYAKNRHHPEHFENGIKGMNLVDIVEMLCDWYAATKRHDNGDIMRSIAINQERFGYSDDLKQIFENTYKDLWGNDE